MIFIVKYSRVTVQFFFFTINMMKRDGYDGVEYI